jgi:hypothetical protein
MLKSIDKYKVLPGDVLHCTGTSFIAKAIQLFCRSRINHTALVISIQNILYVIDADGHGVNPKLFDVWMMKNNFKFLISRPDPEFYNISDITNRALSKAGHTRYDFASLFWHQLKYQVTGKWTGKTRIDAEKRMYCSEFVAWVFNIPHWYWSSPYDVYEWTIRNKHFTLIAE